MAENLKQKIIVVCGVKNSGKTTLLVKLVKNLTEKGLRTAVIKHDGHDFSCDVEGTDSYRMKEAGAYGTAVFSEQRIFIHKSGTDEKEKELISLFPEAEMILIEGLKESEYPKIEVIRKDISDKPVSNPKGRFLIVTDGESGEFEEPVLHPEQIEEIVELMMKQQGNGEGCYER